MSWRHEIFNTKRKALADIVETAGLGLWEITARPGASKITASEAVIRLDGRSCQILGLPDQERELDIQDMFNFIHEADREGVARDLARLLETPGASNALEYRLHNQADGTWNWVRTFGKSYVEETSGRVYALGGSQRLQGGPAFQYMLDQLRSADERAQIMLDATPLCCNFWDENINNIDCNQEAAKLFDLPDKQAYLDNFHKLSPEYQPDGRLSAEKAMGLVREAFEKGKVVFEWMHQKLNGEPIPAEITLVRVKRGDNYIVVGYTRDLREYKRMMAEMRQADERAQIMLDATPLCCNFWDENSNNIDCNQEAAKLFGLPDKQA